MVEVPETEGLREFAVRLGCKPGYVTELKAAGRLVLSDDGRRVRVAESLALIRDTRDPARAGVAARHAAARGQGGGVAAPSPSAPATGADAGDVADPAPASFDDPHARRRARAMADKEEALARKALRDEQVELGQLLQRDQVEAAIAGAATLLRTSLENLAATLAPQVAALDDEARCKVLLDTSIEHSLEELSRKFATIGRATE